MISDDGCAYCNFLDNARKEPHKKFQVFHMVYQRCVRHRGDEYSVPRQIQGLIPMEEEVLHNNVKLGNLSNLTEKNGDQVAVKVFNNLSFMRPSSVQQREFEVLLKLKHQNVVKLIAIEEDQLQKQPVLVMELCTGGSLYSMLEDPENSYGLQETEFLKVLGDISAGMKHLREMDIVHRDIKPGNIMRVKDDDGKFMYKLADFGAARELEEDQPYMSLYGTEEYLHPDLYQRAVLRQHTNQAFTARTDLWSTGVTIYHTATGVLPFRPFGGRKNRDIMFHITTKKASGIISAVQKDSPGGEIEMSEQLPAHCHISLGLRVYITKMLAGLMECNMLKMWTFDELFDHVRMILELVVIYVFVPRTSALLKVFVANKGKFAAFQEQISSLTKIPDKDQLYFFEFDEFVPDVSKDCSAYPKTTADNPIILISRNSENFPTLVIPSQPSTRKSSTHYSLENDLALAKMYAAVLYYQQGVLEETITKQNLYFLVPKTIHRGKFEVFLQDSVQIYKQFRKDRQAKKLSYNEEQIHKMDKDKLGMKLSGALSLFSDHCESKWKKIHNCYKDWWNNDALLLHRSQAEDVQAMMHSFIATAHRLRDSISEVHYRSKSSKWMIMNTWVPTVISMHYPSDACYEHPVGQLAISEDSQPDILGQSQPRTRSDGCLRCNHQHEWNGCNEGRWPWCRRSPRDAFSQAQGESTFEVSSSDLRSSIKSLGHVVETVAQAKQGLEKLKESGQSWMKMTKKQKMMLSILDQSVQSGIPILENAKVISTG
ncbi:putative serine/threonine-protein kinase TBK1-like [Apostichopus japonicus]|uniref:Putative serine/threonine-protein kinase TBK1-like n=1 Tax=Stichopus japonicus TaxID=307972 RepID=A0A2G8KAP6_STIJA|nr:putative serine/threonine-protein kinase TBK1-like [Apostichopus japonicus]